MSNTSDYSTRIKVLIDSLTIKGRRTALVEEYCQHFGFMRDSFYRRVLLKMISSEEMDFFENYFREKVPGGKKLLKN